MADRHIANLDRRDLGENRRRWGEVGCPIRDGARSASIPEGRIEVEVLSEALCMDVEGLNFVHDRAGGSPGHIHRHVECVARHKVEDGNGRTQARRGEALSDLESRVERRAEGLQQQSTRAVVKLGDKDVGLRACVALSAVDFRKGLDTATGTVEDSKGGQTMEPEHGGASRGGCMGPWGGG